MRYYYAELNGSNIVKCILETHSPMGSTTMIQIESFDTSLLGQSHVGSGVFEVPG